MWAGLPEDMDGMGEITDLLQHTTPKAREAVFEQLYSRLKHMARGQLAKHARPVAGPTSLLHEAYLKLATDTVTQLQSSEHFLSLASRVMRQIMIDRVRENQAEKRGGDAVQVSLDDVHAQAASVSYESLHAMDRALDELAEVDARLVQVVELYFFAGLTAMEVAELLGTSDRTIKRDWRRAKAILAMTLGEDAFADMNDGTAETASPKDKTAS